MSIDPVTNASAGQIAARRSRALRGAGVAVALVIAATIGAAAWLDHAWLDTGALALRAGVLAVVGGALVLWLVLEHLRDGAFGAANVVTLGRGGLTVLLLALLDAGTTSSWWPVALALLAVVLDGVDGALARGRAETSAFGARFDMETDALLILVLAALVWQHGKAGAWVLLAGVLRYAFVAAGRFWRALSTPLPPSRRRQAVCVVQIVSLIGALAPPISPPVSSALAFAGLAALAWSFALDTAWLARQPRA
jgi:phosphatidylglycerophosphate synthase